jgi:hypothetical protein
MPRLEAALVPRRLAEKALLARDANLDGFVRSSGPQDSKANRSVLFCHAIMRHRDGVPSSKLYAKPANHLHSAATGS